MPRRMPLDEVYRFRAKKDRRLHNSDLVSAWHAYHAPVVDPEEETARIPLVAGAS